MKHSKTILTAIGFLILVFGINLLFGCASSKNGCPRHQGMVGYGLNRIEKTTTDERGLTSVVFIQDNKEWALDYLTGHELDSLKKSLK